jgi:heme exporter protein A
MNLPLLEATALVRRFGGVRALGGVSLAVAPGELVLLLGPNGAGKTTLLRTIAGLARPSGGRVTVAGRDVHREPAARAALGFLSHHALLYDDLTPRENLRFAATLHGLDDAERRIERALAAAALVPRADRPVRGFSRGMLQRLALARALLPDPPLLLLDEPFTGLDLPSAEVLRHRLAAERAAGRALVCVTHGPEELWAIATRVIVLVGGTVRLDLPRPDDLGAFRAELAEVLVA